MDVLVLLSSLNNRTIASRKRNAPSINFFIPKWNNPNFNMTWFNLIIKKSFNYLLFNLYFGRNLIFKTSLYNLLRISFNWLKFATPPIAECHVPMLMCCPWMQNILLLLIIDLFLNYIWSSNDFHITFHRIDFTFKIALQELHS